MKALAEDVQTEGDTHTPSPSPFPPLDCVGGVGGRDPLDPSLALLTRVGESLGTNEITRVYRTFSGQSESAIVLSVSAAAPRKWRKNSAVQPTSGNLSDPFQRPSKDASRGRAFT